MRSSASILGQHGIEVTYRKTARPTPGVGFFESHDRVLAGTVVLADSPPLYASEDGKGNARETIASVQALPIPPAQKEQILGGNLRQLLGI